MASSRRVSSENGVEPHQLAQHRLAEHERSAQERQADQEAPGDEAREWNGVAALAAGLENPHDGRSTHLRSGSTKTRIVTERMVDTAPELLSSSCPCGPDEREASAAIDVTGSVAVLEPIRWSVSTSSSRPRPG